MRNAVILPNGFVLTTDNSAGIGEKEHDVVQVADEVVAYFAARVALMEQWASESHPMSIIVHNFSGNQSWEKYMSGIEKVFQEIGLPCPVVTGSTESNMEMLQSAIAVTMIGEKRTSSITTGEFVWFIYGKPCVGEEVLTKIDEIADLKKVWDAMECGLVMQVWPVGSAGIAAECQRLGLRGELEHWDVLKSAGPTTSILLGIVVDRIEEAQEHFGKHFMEID